jgi:hypothetical protein
MGVPHGTPGEGVSAAIAHSLVFKVPPNHALQADWNPAQLLASLAMSSPFVGPCFVT